MFPQPGASSNARSIVPLPMSATFGGLDGISLVFKLARNGQQYCAHTMIARTAGESTTMIGSIPKVERLVIHAARTRPDERSSGTSTIGPGMRLSGHLASDREPRLTIASGIPI